VSIWVLARIVKARIEASPDQLPWSGKLGSQDVRMAMRVMEDPTALLVQVLAVYKDHDSGFGIVCELLSATALHRNVVRFAFRPHFNLQQKKNPGSSPKGEAGVVNQDSSYGSAASRVKGRGGRFAYPPFGGQKLAQQSVLGWGRPSLET
jgi:hypothetical protein